MKTLINALSEISYDFIDELKEVGNVVVKKRRLTKRFWLFTSVAAVTVSVGAYAAIASNFLSGPNDIESGVYSSGNDGVVIFESSEMIESSFAVSQESSFDAESPSESSEISDESSQPVIDDDPVYECKLIVNGKDITEGSGVKMYSDRVELPFVAIMEALGREFEWENDKKAVIKNDVFVLHVDTGELLLQGLASSPNFFDVFDDKPLEYTAMDKEILIDETNAGAFFSEEGILLEINYEEMVIRISDDNNDYECTLIVNGKDVSEGSRAVLRKDDGHYFLLPIVEILGELGAEFEWENDTLANFKFREQEYVLDISGHQVYLTTTDEQLIGIVVGGTAKFIEMKQELLMDNILAKGFFESIGVNMNCDYDSRTVELTFDESAMIDPHIIYYNPETIQHLRFYDINGFETGVKGTPGEFLEKVYIGDEAYFCIEFIDYYNQTFTDEGLDLLSYLESVGFVIDEELTEKLVNYDKDGEIKKYIGYVSVKDWNKLVADDYKIQYNWLSEACVKGQCSYHYSGD
ncbi:MAG: hypothetical protein IKK70_06710 [Clostridia bacterium]|nr:hypothetical protein [Clostridia bacterium]